MARGEVATSQADRLGHRQFDHVEALLAWAHLAQALQVFLQRGVVRRSLVGFGDREDRARADEAGEVIDVAVGVVVGEAFANPEEFVDGEAVVDGSVKGGIISAFGTVRVILHGFSREEQAIARDFNAAAFEFKGIAEFLQAEARRNLARHLVVE